jgi:thiamine-phosphate diphosphorylase
MRLYAVTDSSYLGGRSLEECVEDALRGGATFVQLREKNVTAEELAALGAKIKAVTDRFGVPLVINDSVEAAIMCGADGVHVGQDDTSAADARRRLGKGKIVGVSAHSVREALDAQADGADYIGVGAMFPTATKKDANPMTPERLKEICAAVDIPVVIIGGLKKDNIARFKGCGADGAAVVSAIFAADDIQSAARELRAVCDDTFGAV